MKYLLVINPVSGDIDKENFMHEADKLLLSLGHQLVVFKTSGENDEEKLKKRIAESDPDRILAGGGDGTILLTCKAVLNNNIPIGIIPLGSANGMAAELDVRKNPHEALKDVLMSEYIRDLDLLKVNDQFYSLHIGDLGTNAEIVKKFEEGNERGISAYARYFIDGLRNSETFGMKIKTEEESIEDKGIMLAICNGRTYGTGIPINVKGEPGDGKFELVIINRVNINSLIRAGLASFEERFFSEEDLRILSTQKAEIELSDKKTLQLDGEVIGEFDQLKVEIVPAAVKCILKKSDPDMT